MRWNPGPRTFLILCAASSIGGCGEHSTPPSTAPSAQSAPGGPASPTAAQAPPAAGPAPVAAPPGEPAPQPLDPMEALRRAAGAPAKPPAAPVPADAPPRAAAGTTAPIESKLTPTGPVGLWFMTRAVPRQISREAWYFTPDGHVFADVKTGVTPEDLAAQRLGLGRFTWTATRMTVTWGDGTKDESAVDRDDSGFMWDQGSYTPVSPYADVGAVAGTYEGSSQGGADTADAQLGVARSIEFKADGTYRMESVAVVRGSLPKEEGSGSRNFATAEGTLTGTWTLDGFTITMKGGDGKTRRKLAFPYGSGKAQWMCLGGSMHRKR